jgi:hypothetical protein
MTRILMWKWLVFPPWQCSCALNAVHQEVFHEDQDSSVGAATLQPDLSSVVPQPLYSLISPDWFHSCATAWSLHWFYSHPSAWSLSYGSKATLLSDLSSVVPRPTYSLFSLLWFNSNPTVWSLQWFHNCLAVWCLFSGSTAKLQPDLTLGIQQQPYCLMSPVVSQPPCSLICLQWFHSQPTAFSLCRELFLFLKLRYSLGGCQFESEEETHEKSQNS